MRRLALVGCLLLIALSSCADTARRRSTPASAGETVRVQVGTVPVDVRLATTYATRAQGLAGVASLGPDEGMLFVYPRSGRRRFWMKDCVIPLDIAFLDAHGRVLHVDTVRPPRTPDEAPAETRRSEPCTYVLEVQAGFFARHGLGAGTQVHIPPSVRPEQAE